MLGDEVHQGTGKLSFTGHGVDFSDVTCFTHIKLRHGGAPMATDTVIQGRSIREERISGNSFVKPGNIGSRKSGPKVLAESILLFGMVPLGGELERMFDALDLSPAKVGPQCFVVGVLWKDTHHGGQSNIRVVTI